jgi:hypothetical protein
MFQPITNFSCEDMDRSESTNTLIMLWIAFARVEALRVRQLLGALTTMWVLVGASTTGHTSFGQSDVEDLEAGGMGEEHSAPQEPG